MPIVAWGLVVAVQRRGIPDAVFRLDDLTLVDPDPPTRQPPRVHKVGRTWRLAGASGRGEFTVRNTFAFVPGASQEPLMLYVPSVERNLEVFLNGVKIGDGGRLTPVPERNRHRPLLFTIPLGLLRPGPNTLDLRVVNDYDTGFLQPVYLGPRAPLESAYRWQYAFKVTSMQVIMVALLLMVLFIGALWLRRPGETAYGWFSAGLLFWSVYNLVYLVTREPLGRVAWQAVNHAALALYLCCMIFFVHRLAGIRPRGLERAVLALTAASAGALAIASPFGHAAKWLIIDAGRLVLLALGLYLLVRLVGLCFTQRTAGIYWLASATVLTFSFGVHDFLRLFSFLDPAVPNIGQYGALVALTVFGYILVGRFADALRESEELNVSLESRVEQKTLELEAQFERTRSLEREMVLAQERERLVRDMHDGMGSQLVSLLTLVRSGRKDPQFLEAGLEECLQDLRLVIDSMDTAGEDLAVGLGMLRSRLEPRLRGIGLTVHWDTHGLPEGIRLGPEGVLQVFRILQEALQNAIKHSGARTLWVKARAEPAAPTIVLTVRDDGIGLPASADGGRGLANMRRRAERLGAVLTVARADPGTQVTLSLTPSSRPPELG
jgi:signal transduction histidine kinase